MTPDAADGYALGRAVLDILALAAHRWATGRHDAAVKLTRAAWALVGYDSEFIDDEAPLDRGAER